MKPPSIALVMSGKPHAAPEHDEGEEEYEDLSPEEIAEHKKEAADDFIAAVKRGDAAKLLEAFEALHGLDHAAWEHEGDEPEPKEEDEEEAEEPEDEEAAE